MSRIRTVKPELFKHEELFELEKSTGLPIRVAWIGLFTCCDREGRFKWRPRQLKTDILPYDDVDFSQVLDTLFAAGFVNRYRVDSEDYGCIPTWKSHQIINNRECDSSLPEPPKTFSIQPVDACPTRAPRVPHATRGEGKGKEGKGKELNTCVEPAKAVSPQAVVITSGESLSPERPIAGTLPLNDNSDFSIYKPDVEEWRKLYPAVDVMQELRAMKGWCLSHKQRRKTRGGIKKFINSWLARAQDGAKGTGSYAQAKPPQIQYADIREMLKGREPLPHVGDEPTRLP